MRERDDKIESGNDYPDRSTKPKRRVLIVDDLPLVRLSTAITLRSLGFDTDEAANGLDALKKFEKNRYCAIFMDYQMPLMDGLECTKRIRELERPTGKHTPIFGMTASNADNIKELLLAAGMDCYLAKDSDTATIHAAISEVLD